MVAHQPDLSRYAEVMSKRDLAEAIIGGDSSLIARIRREDLEVLLG